MKGQHVIRSGRSVPSNIIFRHRFRRVDTAAGPPSRDHLRRGGGAREPFGAFARLSTAAPAAASADASVHFWSSRAASMRWIVKTCCATTSNLKNDAVELVEAGQLPSRRHPQHRFIFEAIAVSSRH